MPRLKELRSQVGQLLIMGFDGTSMSARLRTSLTTLQPAGVILFRRNIQSADQTYAFVRDCRKSMATPGFLCVDLEGGTVDRLKDIIAPAPSAADVAATDSKKLFRKHGRILGDECRALGFNTDFAPVFDLAFEPSKSVLTSRTVSADPIQTIRYARHLLHGLRDSGVLGCGKHFPGLGEAKLDTHKALPSIRKPWKRLWNEDIVPYRELRRDVPFVMVAHAAYPDVTGDNTPASISKKWLHGILREKIGYKGLIISDDLEMGGVLNSTSIEEASVGCIRNGADMFLVCHNEELVWRAYEAVLTTAEKDRRFAARVAKASAHVMKVKKKSKELQLKSKAPTAKSIDQLRRAVWEFSEEIRIAAGAARNA